MDAFFTLKSILARLYCNHQYNEKEYADHIAFFQVFSHPFLIFVTLSSLKSEQKLLMRWEINCTVSVGLLITKSTAITLIKTSTLTFRHSSIYSKYFVQCRDYSELEDNTLGSTKVPISPLSNCNAK